MSRILNTNQTSSDAEDNHATTTSSEDEAWLTKTSSNHSRASQTTKLQKLQRLVQPYFLALDGSTGWHCILLVVALLLCICGAAIVIGSVSVVTLLSIFPVMRSELKRPEDMVYGLWGSAWGCTVVTGTFVGVAIFWTSRRQLAHGRWVPWFMLGLIVLVLLIVNAMNTSIGFIGNFLTNALIAKEKGEFHNWLFVYGMCFVFAAPILTGQFWLRERLGLLWRSWLTRNLIDGWMSNRAYYMLNPNDEESAEVDNPDQRISEDVKVFTNQMLTYIIGAFDSVLMLALNIAVLWHISPKLTIVLLCWSITNTVLLLVAGRQLVNVNYSQLKVEADFRYGLVHIRDNAESIAFFKGEGQEKHESLRRLDTLVTNYNRLILWRVLISVLQRMNSYGGVFIPYLILAPLYLDGEQKYGDFVQAQIAFRMVEDGLSFISSSIDGMALWAAGITRLEGFQTSIADLNTGKGKHFSQGEITQDTGANGIIVLGAELNTPGGQSIVNDLTLSVRTGESVLVAGPSGVGKTSLLRMISGLWVPQTGSVNLPAPGRVMFVPQKPYMILGTLREQLCYPKQPEDFSESELRDILHKVNLGHFIQRYPDLDVKQDWSRILSLGEQQRLSFGRLLLNRPAFAVLDESTSGLDVATERSLYTLLKSMHVGYISVGHRPSLASFHNNVLQLRGQGNWRLMPSGTYNFAESL